VVAAIEKKMLATLRPATVRASFVALRTAIRAWCCDHATEVIIPFPAMPPAPGRDRVISAEEQERIRRYARGTENYHVRTGIWLPCRLSPAKRHGRVMVGRLLDLGLGTGTRPGRLMGLAWAPNAETGHIDLGTGTLYRCPIGAKASARKRAPAVSLSPGLLAEVRRWKEADGDEPYAIRTWAGTARKPYECELWRTAMERLGIRGVTRHTMRHTCITQMIEQRVPSAVIAAVVGISVELLRTRYNHADEAVVQPGAHAAMDRNLGRRG
jgi:integrase